MDDMRRDQQPYLDAVDAYLEPIRGTKYYDGLKFALVDIVHFDCVVLPILRHTSLDRCAVLDSGCSSAGLCMRLLDYGVREVVGVEVDRALCGLARLRTEGVDEIRIVGPTEITEQLPDDYFDVVITSHVVEHVAHAGDYLSELVRLVKPGGVLYASCPNRLWPVEAHSGVPLIHYLPRNCAIALAEKLKVMPWLSEASRRNLTTSQLFEHNFTHWSLRHTLMASGLTVVELDHPMYLIPQLMNHRHVRMIAKPLGRMPEPIIRLMSALVSPSLVAICRKDSQ